MVVVGEWPLLIFSSYWKVLSNSKVAFGVLVLRSERQDLE